MMHPATSSQPSTEFRSHPIPSVDWLAETAASTALEPEAIAALQSLLPTRYCPQRLLSQLPGRQTVLAKDLERNCLVVIKMLTFAETLTWEEIRLFEREAETLRSLDHPSIPRYLDCFDYESETQSGFALVQSYIAAPSLAAHVANGRQFSERDLRKLAEQLLKILQALHERNPPCIHRDIKPSNILLGEFPHKDSDRLLKRAYLIDFGSVQTLAASEGSTLTVVGTYGYMPPEQFGGRASATSDLYSLGATLIYLATGQHPAELPKIGLCLQFEPQAQHLSSCFITWLQQMTAPSFSRRFGSAAAALRALNELPTTSPFLLPVRLRRLPPRPRIAKMKAQWTERGLEISTTRACFTLRTERHVHNPMLHWLLNHRQLLDAVSCLAFVPGLGLIFTAVTGISLLLGSGAPTFFQLLMRLLLFGWGAIALLIWLLPQIREFQQSHQPITLRISETHLTILEAEQVKHQFERRQIWRIRPYQNLSTGKVCISVGAQTLQLRTNSGSEQHWLEKMLSEVLELPVEN